MWTFQCESLLDMELTGGAEVILTQANSVHSLPNTPW